MSRTPSVSYKILPTDDLSILLETERKVIEMRNGLGTYDMKYSRSYIANTIGVSDKRVKAIENNAVAKLYKSEAEMNEQLEYALDASQKEIDKLTDMLIRILGYIDTLQIAKNNEPDVYKWWKKQQGLNV